MRKKKFYKSLLYYGCLLIIIISLFTSCNGCDNTEQDDDIIYTSGIEVSASRANGKSQNLYLYSLKNSMVALEINSRLKFGQDENSIDVFVLVVAEEDMEKLFGISDDNTLYIKNDSNYKALQSSLAGKTINQTYTLESIGINLQGFINYSKELGPRKSGTLYSMTHTINYDPDLVQTNKNYISIIYAKQESGDIFNSLDAIAKKLQDNKKMGDQPISLRELLLNDEVIKFRVQPKIAYMVET